MGETEAPHIKKFPDRSKRFIRVTRTARPNGVKTWHINREGVALAIERSKEYAPEEAKRACSLENWLTCEVYPELPDDEPQEKENEQDKEMKTSIPETKQESGITTTKSDDSVRQQKDCIWQTVLNAYTKNKRSAEEALRQARAARILRKTDYDFQRKQPILWQPEVKK